MTDAATMHATMMHEPLGTAAIVAHGERIHASSRIGLFDGETVAWRSYRETAHRARKLASALAAAGVARNTRVATLSWNDFAHFEAYLAVPAMGAVLHTLNLRLHVEQLDFIMRDAGDRVLIADADLLAGMGRELGALQDLDLLVVTGDVGRIAHLGIPCVAYEDFIAGHAPMEAFPEPDETSAAAACYTSGSTGNPKGVVYSHRTVFLHSLGSMAANAFALSDRDRILLLPPMFHANAWGLPFSGWLAGADFVLPGRHLGPEMIRRMVRQTAPTFTATVPTILNDLLAADRADPIDMTSFRVIVAGGSSVSEALIEQVEARWGVPLIQGWGMTETSPVCVLSHPPADVDPAESRRLRAKSGRPVAGVRVRIVDDDGKAVAEDGQSVGRLQLRGAWIARGYHGGVGAEVLTADGWLDTGDAGTIDERGYVQVTDRLKDLIKSGGEWISSAELENHICGLPGIDLAAVIAVPDPRWEERPLAIVTTRDGARPDFGALRAGLRSRVAGFWIPEYWAHAASLPLTGVGKIDKRALREMVATGKTGFERVEGAA
ncbi:long-chain-fatty-acid--CoA ligase [Croceicoccus sp. BE223]|uniref:long-chain-fatty-acid--CoA ligase n=1 Tax=Croceicoccus sp. BE223 TaxID=2817716 RepID=UPI00285EA161|nr:long-chain-fatty-acid--CoA ligase [Croceicoccus sp. BE223]MDR7101119.1 fatty-acyl-CoA synthase [Croceicoccus sp. BE223]